MFESIARDFDRNNFWADVQNAFRRPRIDDPLEDYIRQRGLRFLIQTRAVEPSDQVRGRLFDAWGRPPEGDFQVQVERLFTDVGDAPTPERLALYHLAVIEGVDSAYLEQSPYDAAYVLMAQSGIQSVEPDLPYRQFLNGVDATANSQGTQQTADKAWALRNMKVDQAWQLVPPGRGVTHGGGIRIAHLDTGWTHHVDLDTANFDWSGSADFIDPNGRAEDPLSGGFPFSPGHGTRTGSVMMSKGGIASPPLPAGTSGPGEITGVATEAVYVTIRCIRSVMVVFAGDIARAVRHATAKSCHVVSMSLGGRPAKALRDAIQDAVSKNLLVVAAAGNDSFVVVYPGRYPECVTLAATNEQDNPWWRSNRGQAVDLSAPGEDVWVAEPKAAPGGTSVGSGTSYATAHLAGVAALWLAFFDRNDLIAGLGTGVRLQDVFRAHLRATVRQPVGWKTHKFGEGIVDAHQLLSVLPAMNNLPVFRKQRWLNLSFLNNGPGVVAAVSWRLKVPPYDVFEHEFANLELDHGRGQLLEKSEEEQPSAYPKMSKTLMQWLTG